MYFQRIKSSEECLPLLSDWQENIWRKVWTIIIACAYNHCAFSFGILCCLCIHTFSKRLCFCRVKVIKGSCSCSCHLLAPHDHLPSHGLVHSQQSLPLGAQSTHIAGYHPPDHVCLVLPVLLLLPAQDWTDLFCQ